MVLAVAADVSPAASWASRLAGFSAVLLVVSGVGHRFGLVETVAFFWLLGLVAGLAVLSLLLAAAGLFQLWMEGRRGAVPSLTAVLVALAVLSPFIVSAWRVYAYPQLADVSTDLADPPPLEAAARERTDRMNPVAPITAANAEAQVESYPEITGRRYQLSADRVLQLAEGLVAAKGWTVLRRTVPLAGADSVIEAEARTMLLALPVDVSIRVSEEGDTSYVDMRSAWRFGRHDFGDNAARIADFLTALDGAVAGAAGMSPREEPGALPVAPDGEIPVPSEPPAD